jgi:hypothetical protein
MVSSFKLKTTVYAFEALPNDDHFTKKQEKPCRVYSARFQFIDDE